MGVETDTSLIQETRARPWLHIRQALGAFLFAALGLYYFSGVYAALLVGRVSFGEVFSSLLLQDRLAISAFFAGILFSLLGLVFMSLAVIRRRILRVSPHGITVGRLPEIQWSEIASVEATSEGSINKGENIALILHKPTKVDRLSRPTKRIVVPTQISDWMSAKAYRIIAEYHRAHSV